MLLFASFTVALFIFVALTAFKAGGKAILGLLLGIYKVPFLASLLVESPRNTLVCFCHCVCCAMSPNQHTVHV